MAKVTPNELITGLHGTIGRNGKVVLRTRNGKVHAYVINNPDTTPPTEAKAQTRRNLSLAAEAAKNIMADPQLCEQWQQRFDKAKGTSRERSSLRTFIISALMTDQ